MQVIGKRLDRLSDTCTRTLAVASLLGREFDLEHVQRLAAGASSEQLQAVVAEALDARVIEEVPEAPEHYQFTHAVVQETLSSTLPAKVRAQTHGRIGAVLEGLYGDQAPVHSAELAYHFSLAVPGDNKEKLIRYSLLAGQRAAATYAHQEALILFKRALDAKDEQEMDDQTAELLIGLSRAQAATLPNNELGPAVDSLRRAFQYYVDSGEPERAVSVVEQSLPSLSAYLTGVTALITRASPWCQRTRSRPGVSRPSTAGCWASRSATTSRPRNPWEEPWTSPATRRTGRWRCGLSSRAPTSTSTTSVSPRAWAKACRPSHTPRRR